METILALLKSVVETYSNLLPQWAVGALLIIGTLRFVVKPVLAIAHQVVAATPSTKDDKAVEKVEQSKWMQGLLFVIDWVSSLKLPPKK